MKPVLNGDVLRYANRDSMLNIMFYKALHDGLLSEAMVLRSYIILVDVLDMKNFNTLMDSEYKDTDELQKFFILEAVRTDDIEMLQFLYDTFSRRLMEFHETAREVLCCDYYSAVKFYNDREPYKPESLRLALQCTVPISSVTYLIQSGGISQTCATKLLEYDDLPVKIREELICKFPGFDARCDVRQLVNYYSNHCLKLFEMSINRIECFDTYIWPLINLGNKCEDTLTVVKRMLERCTDYTYIIRSLGKYYNGFSSKQRNLVSHVLLYVCKSLDNFPEQYLENPFIYGDDEVFRTVINQINVKNVEQCRLLFVAEPGLDVIYYNSNNKYSDHKTQLSYTLLRDQIAMVFMRDQYKHIYTKIYAYVMRNNKIDILANSVPVHLGHIAKLHGVLNFIDNSLKYDIMAKYMTLHDIQNLFVIIIRKGDLKLFTHMVSFTHDIDTKVYIIKHICLNTSDKFEWKLFLQQTMRLNITLDTLYENLYIHFYNNVKFVAFIKMIEDATTTLPKLFMIRSDTMIKHIVTTLDRLKIPTLISQTECPVCYDSLHMMVALNCGHTFCTSCMAQLHKYVCPLCRSNIKQLHTIPPINTFTDTEENDDDENSVYTHTPPDSTNVSEGDEW